MPDAENDPVIADAPAEIWALRALPDPEEGEEGGHLIPPVDDAPGDSFIAFPSRADAMFMMDHQLEVYGIASEPVRIK